MCDALLFSVQYSLVNSPLGWEVLYMKGGLVSFWDTQKGGHEK